MTEDEAQIWLQYRQIRYAWKPSEDAIIARFINEAGQREDSLIHSEQVFSGVTAFRRARSMGGVSDAEGGHSRGENLAVLLT
jgi:hypothetical protein